MAPRSRRDDAAASAWAHIGGFGSTLFGAWRLAAALFFAGCPRARPAPIFRSPPSPTLTRLPTRPPWSPGSVFHHYFRLTALADVDNDGDVESKGAALHELPPPERGRHLPATEGKRAEPIGTGVQHAPTQDQRQDHPAAQGQPCRCTGPNPPLPPASALPSTPDV